MGDASLARQRVSREQSRCLDQICHSRTGAEESRRLTVAQPITAGASVATVPPHRFPMRYACPWSVQTRRFGTYTGQLQVLYSGPLQLHCPPAGSEFFRATTGMTRPNCKETSTPRELFSSQRGEQALRFHLRQWNEWGGVPPSIRVCIQFPRKQFGRSDRPGTMRHPNEHPL